jgi:hypothetical protein
MELEWVVRDIADILKKIDGAGERFIRRSFCPKRERPSPRGMAASGLLVVS